MWERMEIFHQLEPILRDPRGGIQIAGRDLNPAYFVVPGDKPFTEIYFVHRENRIMALVRDDLMYVGENEHLKNLFNIPTTVNGWRLLLKTRTPLEAVTGIERILGLDGNPPRPYRETPKKVVRPVPEKNPGVSGDTDLGRFGQDLVEMARDGKLERCYGREKIIEDLIRIISKRSKNNPILIGEPGVGKTAIVEGLAWTIVEEKVPERYLSAKIIEVNLGALAAGCTVKNQYEALVMDMVKKASKDPDTILFIDEVHMVADPKNDISQLLKKPLSRSEFRMIGATTYEEYRRHILPDAPLARRFREIHVPEMSPSNAFVVLKQLMGVYEEHHNMEIPDELIETAIKLSIRYLPDRRLPDKAIDLLDEACARQRQIYQIHVD